MLDNRGLGEGDRIDLFKAVDCEAQAEALAELAARGIARHADCELAVQ